MRTHKVFNQRKAFGINKDGSGVDRDGPNDLSILQSTVPRLLGGESWRRPAERMEISRIGAGTKHVDALTRWLTAGRRKFRYFNRARVERFGPSRTGVYREPVSHLSRAARVKEIRYAGSSVTAYVGRGIGICWTLNRHREV